VPVPVDLTPWRYAGISGLLITAAAIGCYVLLAQ